MFTFDINNATTFTEAEAARIITALAGDMTDDHELITHEWEGRYVVAEIDEEGHDIHYVRFGRV